MAKQVQLRRGTAAEHAAFTGALGEVTVDTTNNTLVVHDSITAGGHPLLSSAAADLTKTGNITANKLYTTSGIYWSGNGASYSSGSGSGTPGGSDTQIQYNNGGAFGGATNLRYITASGNVVLVTTTNAASTVTGALVSTGGIATAGNIYAGQGVHLANNNSGTTSVFYMQYNAALSAVDFIFG